MLSARVKLQALVIYSQPNVSSPRFAPPLPPKKNDHSMGLNIDSWPLFYKNLFDQNVEAEEVPSFRTC